MLAMGRWVSGLPGAVTLAPAMPLGALVLMSLGGLWLAIWRTRWRWWGWRRCWRVWRWPGVAPRARHAGGARRARPSRCAARTDCCIFVRKPKDRYAARDWLRRDGDSARHCGRDRLAGPEMRWRGLRASSSKVLVARVPAAGSAGGGLRRARQWWSARRRPARPADRRRCARQGCVSLASAVGARIAWTACAEDWTAPRR